jgi:hypothetical protein
MVCFCDIPISRLADHLSYYGNYGIGMPEEWGIKNGLNPVTYVNTNSSLCAAHSNIKELKKKDLIPDHLTILGYTKPLSGTVKKTDGTITEKEFYQECEWRYMPLFNKEDDIFYLISEEEFCDTTKLALHNEKVKNAFTLQVTPDDISYILVSEDSDIPKMYDFISIHLGHHSANSIKGLTTRIISLHRLLGDI